MDRDGEDVWAAVNAIYAAYLAGDRDAIDRHVAHEATIWDSAHEPLIRSRAELDDVRDARPVDGPRPSGLDALDPVIDVYGDVALVRHTLVVTFPPESGRGEQRIRNTSVWRRSDERWLCVHNHEDLI